MCALMVLGILIYTLTIIILPKHYDTYLNTQTQNNIELLVAKINDSDLTKAKEQIYNFCIDNSTYALLQSGSETYVFGDKNKIEDNKSYNFTSTVQFKDSDEISILNVIVGSSTGNEITKTMLGLIPIMIILILIISTFCAWLCSKNIVKPILMICSISKRMANLDMTWRCDVKRSDELGTLSQNLNTLSSKLDKTMTELKTANQQLQNDILETQLMEKQRRDFFSTASHELKTPVTIIRAQIESMLMGIGDYKNHDKYLKQSLNTLDTMQELIQEILSITKMESGIEEDYFKEESILELINDCVDTVTPLAKEKNILIKINDFEDFSIKVYSPLFCKAINNVIINAITYSPVGQTVTIDITSEKISIENSGVIISNEDLPLLFAPFYRAEKSRNRKTGGSGLGLYIVKTIMDLHGFTCSLSNGENSVIFQVKLNQN